MNTYSQSSQLFSHRSSLLHMVQCLDKCATSVPGCWALFHIQAASWCSDNTSGMMLKQSWYEFIYHNHLITRNTYYPVTHSIWYHHYWQTETKRHVTHKNLCMEQTHYIGNQNLTDKKEKFLEAMFYHLQFHMVFLTTTSALRLQRKHHRPNSSQGWKRIPVTTPSPQHHIP